jgi:hypothetical protein
VLFRINPDTALASIAHFNVIAVVRYVSLMAGWCGVTTKSSLRILVEGEGRDARVQSNPDFQPAVFIGKCFR